MSDELKQLIANIYVTGRCAGHNETVEGNYIPYTADDYLEDFPEEIEELRAVLNLRHNPESPQGPSKQSADNLCRDVMEAKDSPKTAKIVFRQQ